MHTVIFIFKLSILCSVSVATVLKYLYEYNGYLTISRELFNSMLIHTTSITKNFCPQYVNINFMGVRRSGDTFNENLCAVHKDII